MNRISSSIISISLALIFSYSVTVEAQAQAQNVSVPDNTLSENYRCMVKSVDEFMARFNGLESHPDVTADSNMLKANICALFDLNELLKKDNKEQRMQLMYAFCDSVVDNNIRLALDNGTIYAIADCMITYDARKLPVKLGLLQETTPDDYTRWGVYAVSGLEKTGIIKAQRLYNFSPVEHEINFMGLSDIFNENPADAFGYRYSTCQIDNLTAFLLLIQLGKLRIDMVESMKMICIAVPGFIFEIMERPRDSHNSGWLITKLTPATVNEKTTYLNNLFTK